MVSLLLENDGKGSGRKIILTFRPAKAGKNRTVIDLKAKTLEGPEDKITDDLRDFLRKIGVRVFTERNFAQMEYKVGFRTDESSLDLKDLAHTTFR